AFMRAALLRGRAAVVGPLHGCDHRVLVVAGVAVAAVRCLPPRVTGDGVGTIRDLIALANIEGDAKRRAPIPCDGATELALARPLAAQQGCVVAIDPSPDVAIYHSAGGADIHGIGRSLMGLLFPEA